MSRAVVVVSVILLLGGPAVSEAQIYRWVDDRGVANFSDGLDSVPEKYRATAVPLGLRNTPPTPTAPAPAGQGAAGESRPGATGGTQIRFTVGKAVIVDALLNGSTPSKLLLDTGAERTVINPRILTAAGARLTTGERGQLRGATGTAPVQSFELESVAVGAAKVNKLAVVSHDIEQDGVDGLLGRDFLDQFQVAIDSKAGIVTLSPK